MMMVGTPLKCNLVTHEFTILRGVGRSILKGTLFASQPKCGKMNSQGELLFRRLTYCKNPIIVQNRKYGSNNWKKINKFTWYRTMSS